MKKDNSILLVAGAIIGTLLWKRNNTSGVGAVKRRIWTELDHAQQANIDLDSAYDDLSAADHRTLERLANQSGFKQSPRSNKPYAEAYYGQLRRAYKSIAGTDLPYDESVVRNENDDVILVYRDYHTDQLPQKAAEWIANNLPSDSIGYGYWSTIADIALGRVKFVWGTKGVHRGVEDLVFGAAAPTERKQRISYLASEAKGGIYPEQYAHRLWEATGGSGDDQEISDGIYQAIRECTSVGQARKMCVDQYIQAHTVQRDQLWQDVPF